MPFIRLRGLYQKVLFGRGNKTDRIGARRQSRRMSPRFCYKHLSPAQGAKHNVVRSMMQHGLHSRTALLCGTGRLLPIILSDGEAIWFTHNGARECGSLEPAQRQRESRPRRDSFIKGTVPFGASASGEPSPLTDRRPF